MPYKASYINSKKIYTTVFAHVVCFKEVEPIIEVNHFHKIKSFYFIKLILMFFK